MNYFGHVALASGFNSSPEFLFGSMLPDLAGIVGRPTPGCLCETVQQGVRFHLLTDEEFHRAEAFRGQVESIRRVLEVMGVRKAPARAVSHVMIELLLDAELSKVAPHGIAFKTALRAAGPKGVAACLQWGAGTVPDRFESLRLRLIERSTCRDFFAKDRLVDRLVYALSHRPRLKLASAERIAVHSWVHSRSVPNEDELTTLWNRVRERVSARWQSQSWPDSRQRTFSPIMQPLETTKLRQA